MILYLWVAPMFRRKAEGILGIESLWADIREHGWYFEFLVTGKPQAKAIIKTLRGKGITVVKFATAPLSKDKII